MTLRSVCCFLLAIVPTIAAQSKPESNATAEAAAHLAGYSTDTSPVERSWEKKFQEGVVPGNIRENMRRLSARPHHVGSPYDKDNAEWILARFKEWGFEARIETFNVLFPTPKERVVELVEPTKFRAKLQEPALALDPTSNQAAEQLPTYNAYSADGDVTAQLVYVNYGNREDYEQFRSRAQSLSPDTAKAGAASSRKSPPSMERLDASFTRIQRKTDFLRATIIPPEAGGRGMECNAAA